MKSKISVLACSLTAAALITACNGSSSGSKKDSQVRTGFAMTGSGANAVAQTRMDRMLSFMLPSAYALTPPLLVDSSGANISLNEAWVVIEKIEFEGAETGDDGDDDFSVELKGPFFVDLLSDAPNILGEPLVTTGKLRRVKMQLHEEDDIPAGAPAGLAGKSIYLRGEVNGIPFSYAADESSQYEISGPNGVTPEESQNLLAVIRTADLIKKIDLSSIIAPTDITTDNKVFVANACPLIDPSANELYVCFRKGLEQEADFGKDDGDMDLDENDDSVDSVDQQ